MTTITASQLAAKLPFQCEILRGDADLELKGVANISDAGPDQLVYYTDTFYKPQLKVTRAGAILIKRGENPDDLPPAALIIASADPEMAFLEAVRIFHPETARQPGIHSSALIEAGVEMGADVHIGPRVFIESGTRIGKGTTILANTVIGRDCVIGDDCLIYPNVTLYHAIKIGRRVIVHSGAVLGADGFGYKFRNGKYIKIPHVGWVEIDDDVEIGANSCIDRSTLGANRVGAGTKIDNLVQIAHNNEIGKHCILCGQSAMSGSCKLEDYVILGGNAALANHAHMAKGSKVAAKSGVSGYVPPGQEVWGYIARERRMAVRGYVAMLKLPELVARVKELEKQLGCVSPQS